MVVDVLTQQIARVPRTSLKCAVMLLFVSVLCGVWVCFNFLWSALRASHFSKLVCALCYINTVVVSSPPVRWTSATSRVKSHVPISKME